MSYDTDKHICRNCAFWHRYPKRTYDRVHHKDGGCECPKLFHSGESRDRTGTKRLRRDPDHTPINGLRFWAGDDWGGGFAVGPEFGCVHWEPRS